MANIKSIVFLFLLFFAGPVCSAVRYTPSECQALGTYLLDALKKKHKQLTKSLAHTLASSCLLSEDVARKAVWGISRDDGLLAVKVLTILGAPLDSALDAAIYWKRTEIVKYLLVHGADVYGLIEASDDMAPPEFIPLLHYAIRESYREGVELLIKHGYDVNRAHEGITPLMVASWYGQGDSVKILLNAGAQTGAQDQSGYTAFDYAFIGPQALGWSRLDAGTLALLNK